MVIYKKLIQRSLLIRNRNFSVLKRYNDEISMKTMNTTMPQTITTKQYEMYLKLPFAVETYHKKTKHFIIPRNYVIPVSGISNDDNFIWPESLRGMKLWATFESYLTTIHKMKKQLSYDVFNVQNKLRELGFPVEVENLYEYEWKEGWFPAFKTFRNIHGHLLVPASFKVPIGNPKWPITTWGRKLGYKTISIRHTKVKPYVLEDLKTLNFTFDFTNTMWSQLILPGLYAHKSMIGHCNVARHFKVPAIEPWPKKLWGLNLGTVVSDMRHKGYYREQAERDRKQLTSIGFKWTIGNWNRRVLPCLKMFREVCGHCNIPRDFVVPAKSPWPKNLWNLPLGETAYAIQIGDDYKIQAKKYENVLKEIGFGMENITKD